MKALVSQLSFFVSDHQARRNLGALLKFFLFMLGVMLVYTTMFHYLMLRFEGQEHSWLTGFYWTLTVMSTLGFGDITFHTDIGRLFSILVLLSGTVLLLIMLPFAFIRFFYAPWLEAQIRHSAPRSVGPKMAGHVIICCYDAIAQGLIQKLEFNHIPYFVLEADPVAAARMMDGDISVVTGEVDSSATYERLRVAKALAVIANAEDTTNTNIILTVRNVSPDVPIFSLAEDEDSIDIHELSGATYTLPLKQKLGEHLAARITAGPDVAHVVGRFQDLQIVEFVVHETELVHKTLKETGLRERTGINVVGVWEEGRLQSVHPDLVLSPFSVPVAVGTEENVKRLNDLLGAGDTTQRPVLVIGGGKVGRTTAKALKRRGLAVRVVEKDETLRKVIKKQIGDPTIGDAADRDVLLRAGLESAGAVVLTTNSDAVNIHLTVYCRRLKSELNIVSRITHERNTEAIYRAGADFALSYPSLGREYIIARLLGREPVMVGEGGDFFLVPVPQSLAGVSLEASKIGQRSGLIVIAIEEGQQVTRTNPTPDTLLALDQKLLMIGTAAQRMAFSEAFE